jgi:hypothetical protein
LDATLLVKSIGLIKYFGTTGVVLDIKYQTRGFSLEIKIRA